LDKTVQSVRAFKDANIVYFLYHLNDLKEIGKEVEIMYQTIVSHVHLKVRDLNRAIAFYTQFFHLEVVERVGEDYAFLTGSAVHHEIALQNVGPHAPQPHPSGVGLYHIAFEVPDKYSLAEAYQTLREAGVSVALVDHLISWAMYFDDPDGNGLELFWDTRQEPGGTVLWKGHNISLPEEKLLATLSERRSE
jgi:catechol 2,3-dioxygenase